jgi:hypothetical protein
MNTKNVLMFVVLSIGMLTALGATAMSQVEPAFADKNKKECEDNENNNCNDETQKIELENKCKTENDIEDDSNGNTNTNTLICRSLAQNPDDGDATVNDDDFVSNEPGDIPICHIPPGNPSNPQTLFLSEFAANSHLANHPFDTPGECPADEVFGPSTP